MLTDSRTTLRRSEDREDHAEGIPMALALVSEVGELPPCTDPVARTEGARIAGEMGRLWSELAPTLRDDDMGVVLTVLRATSYGDFAE